MCHRQDACCCDPHLCAGILHGVGSPAYAASHSNFTACCADTRAGGLLLPQDQMGRRCVAPCPFTTHACMQRAHGLADLHMRRQRLAQKCSVLLIDGLCGTMHFCSTDGPKWLLTRAMAQPIVQAPLPSLTSNQCQGCHARAETPAMLARTFTRHQCGANLSQPLRLSS